MTVLKTETMPISTEADLVRMRQNVRSWSAELAFGVVDQTKIVTAASELGRNTLVYGGGGTIVLEVVQRESRRGLRLVFEDHGPGIADLAQAMKDGFTSGSGMGLGLGGSKRLMNEFELVSRVGEGTRVTITRWK